MRATFRFPQHLIVFAFLLAAVASCDSGSPTQPGPVATVTTTTTTTTTTTIPADSGESNDPPAPPPAPTPPPAPRLTVTKFMAFGDSMTAGVISARGIGLYDDSPSSYPSVLRGLLSMRYTGQTFTVVNEGKAGELAADGMRRFPSAIRGDSPDVVLLLEGANDLNVFGRSGLRNTVRALEEMAKETRFRGARLFLAGLPPTYTGSSRTADFEVKVAPDDLVVEFNEEMRRVAQGEGAVFVDLHSAMRDPSLIGGDGLHPTPAGYQVIAQTFFNEIARTFERAGTTTSLTGFHFP